MSSLEQALRAASPRLSPPPTPLASTVIHLGALLVWAVLLSRAFVATGLIAWSSGVAYILYDTALLLFVGRQMLGLRRAVPAAPDTVAPVRPTLGVIIAAHNEAQVLPVTIAGLLAQSDPPDLIVIADDGSTDDTGAVLATRYGMQAPPLGGLARAGSAAPTLAWMRLPHGGKATALNAAIVAVETDVVLTVDADTELAHGAIGAMRTAFAAEQGLVAATGILVPVCAQTASGRAFQFFQTYEYIRNFMARYAWMRADGLLLISGAFAGFRRAALVAVGGFDATCLTEDYELIHRLRRHAADHGLDWRVRVLGDAHARTDAPGSPAVFLRQRARWFGGFLQTQYWYRAMTGNRRYGAVGLRMLPVKALDTLQPIYGLTGAALLLFYAATGRVGVLVPAFGLVGAKIVFDLCFYLWSIRLYRRWTGDPAGTSYAAAVLAAVLEPFSFQILRHLGAALGWFSVLRRGSRWRSARRLGLLEVGSQTS
jgi:cellulose synthase/poly-beta-1,6-N-acetylglucosamine synthase-like glycosyltransferase